MRWLKRDIWRVGIPLAGLLLFSVLLAFIPVSASAYEGIPELATPGMAQATPTVDLTVTALAKEQLTLQVKQLQNQLQDQNNWFVRNSTALIAATATVIVALFGIFQWAITVRQAQSKELRDREDERKKEVAIQDKELRAQAEERFKTAVTALGDENEATQVGGAILLRSFLNPDDKEIYGRYYTQIFDLAVAYLRLSSKTQSHDPNTPLPLTSLRQALSSVFGEVFPLARDQNKGKPRSLDASHIQLDNAQLTRIDLEQASMQQASLRYAQLGGANLTRAFLSGANLKGANLRAANFSKAGLNQANLSHADLQLARLDGAVLFRANLSQSILSRAHFNGTWLQEANLMGADLTKANIGDTQYLSGTDLRGVKGVTKEQLLACKEKGAIIDEDPTTSLAQPAISPPSSQSSNAQVPSTSSAQESTSPPDSNGSNSTSSQPEVKS